MHLKKERKSNYCFTQYVRFFKVKSILYLCIFHIRHELWITAEMNMTPLSKLSWPSGWYWLRCIGFKQNKQSQSSKNPHRWQSTRGVPQSHVTLEHKSSLKSLEYICSNSQQYIEWVKIIDFSFMSKIIRILRSCSMKIFCIYFVQ